MALKRTRLKSALPQTATWRAGQKRPLSDEPPPSDSAASGGAREGAARMAPPTTMTKRRLQRRMIPLEVLQQPLQAGVRKVFDLRRFLLALALTGVVLLLPAPAGLSEEAHRAIALFIFTGAVFALEPAPLPIAALMSPVAQVALGIDDIRGAFSAFGDPVVFLILGSLFMAEALRKHELTRRLALYAIVRSGGQFNRLLLLLMIITGLLSMWVLNTATAAVLLPVALTIAQRVQRSEDAKPALTILLLGIAYSASLGGMATIMGGGENAIASGLLGQVTSFGFLDWMLHGLPLMAILLPLTWFLLLRVLRIPTIVIDTKPAAKEIERMGGITAPGRETLLVLLISVFFWIMGSSIEGWLSLPATLLSSTVVAIAAVALLSIEEVVDWNDLKGVNWGVFFIIGAGLTMGDALEKTGANTWFATQLAPLLDGLPYATILIALIFSIFILTQSLNSVVLGAIISPILISLGQASGIPPVQLVLPAIFALTPCYMLPNSSARMTLVALTGGVSRRDMVRTGFIVGVISEVVILLFFYISGLMGWI